MSTYRYGGRARRADLASRRRDEVSQRLLERSQPRLEIPPLVETFLEDRPPHLLGAGRAHAALILPELQARGLELQVAEVEELAHVAFEVLHDVLVVD